MTLYPLDLRLTSPVFSTKKSRNERTSVRNKSASDPKTSLSGVGCVNYFFFIYYFINCIRL